MGVIIWLQRGAGSIVGRRSGDLFQSDIILGVNCGSGYVDFLACIKGIWLHREKRYNKFIVISPDGSADSHIHISLILG